MPTRFVRESRKRTLLRSLVWSASVTAWASVLTFLWFGDWTRSISLNAVIIVLAWIGKYFYERYWLHISWGLEKVEVEIPSEIQAEIMVMIRRLYNEEITEFEFGIFLKSLKWTETFEIKKEIGIGETKKEETKD